MDERRALQIAVGLAGLVPVLAGLAGMLEGTGLTGDRDAGASLDSHVRYLSGLLFGLGLTFWASIPRIERARLLFGVLTVMVVLGGFARLLGLFLVRERPGETMQAALVMELAVTPALAMWQARVARKYGG